MRFTTQRKRSGVPVRTAAVRFAPSKRKRGRAFSAWRLSAIASVMALAGLGTLVAPSSASADESPCGYGSYVCLYADLNYTGRVQYAGIPEDVNVQGCINLNIQDITNFDDIATSIFNPSHRQISIHEHPNHGGRWFMIAPHTGVNDLRRIVVASGWSLDDQVSSVCY